MSKVRGADTKPEWILRCGLHRLGFRYRIGNRRLPGKPDLVFPKYRSAVFVHGCFWHRHPGCKEATTPKSNTRFWTRKFTETVERDRRSVDALKAAGWRVRVVWECELVHQTVETVARTAAWLHARGGSVRECHYGDSVLPRTELLAIADEKVRYRIDAYRRNEG